MERFLTAGSLSSTQGMANTTETGTGKRKRDTDGMSDVPPAPQTQPTMSPQSSSLFRYLGRPAGSEDSDSSDLHFPGIGQAAAEWLVQNR